MEDFRELAWDDEISNEGNEYILLPEGDYDFTALSVERARFTGSEKMPPCNMAKVKITIWGENDKIDITENFMLCSTMEWKLSSFFLSLGLKKHGEPLRMNWNAVAGSRGKCHIYIDTYKKKDDSQGQSNKIKKFYAYDETVTTVSPKPQYAPPQQQNTPQYQQQYIPPQQQYQPVQQPPQQAGNWKAGQF